MTSVIVPSVSVERGGEARSLRQRLFESALGAAAMLTLLYGALLFAVDVDGNVGSDVGGKTATVDALVTAGSLDLGYWAAEYDEDGSVHPMYSTTRFGERWVNVTTLPMVLAAWPLAEVGGLRLAMLLPLLGGVLAALAARRLADDLGGNGVLAFWAVGLATPTAFYALSFWEHGLGVALIGWGLVAWNRATGGSVAHALGSGVLFGAAATMRQEALVYGFVAGLVLLATQLQLSERGSAAARARIGRSLASGGAMAGGALLVLFGNRILEQAVLGEAFRDGRTAGTATTIGSDLGRRVHDAVLTTIAPFGSVSAVEAAIGSVLVVAVAVAAIRASRAEDARPPLVVVGLIYLLVAMDVVVNGLSFMPAMFVVTPLAVVGIVLGLRRVEGRPLVAVAVGAMPLIWAVQYTNGMAAQWGGRYLLASGWTLVVLACAFASPVVRSVLVVTLSAGLATSALGIAWTIQRTNVIGESSRALADIDAEVVVFSSSLDSRQTGSVAVDGRWLAADGPEELDEALGVLAAAGIDEFAYVDIDLGNPPIEVRGFQLTDEDRIDFLAGFEYRITTFVRTDG